MIILTENKKNQQKFLVILCFLLCFFTSCNFKEKPSEEKEPAQNNQDQTQEAVAPQEENVKGKELQEKAESKAGLKEKVVAASSQTDTGIVKSFYNKNKTKRKNNPFTAWSSNETTNQYWTKLKAVAQSASAYYAGYSKQAGLRSKGGKMFHTLSGEFVGVRYLCKNVGMDPSLIDFSCDVLLIKGSDLAGLSGAEDFSDNMGFGVFTAALQPSGSKIMLSTPQGSAGMISEKDYRFLLSKYSQQHGRKTRLFPGDEEYERILNFIRVYEGKYDEYFVRNIISDDKYAVVTLSSVASALDIKQYILMKENSIWEVVMEGLEKEYDIELAVNQKLPDFNQEILPDFNIAVSRNDFKADCSDIHRELVYKGLIEQVSQIRYQCATAKFAYIVLFSGEKFLAVKESASWEINSVFSSKEAYDIMKNYGGEPFAFILWEE